MGNETKTEQQTVEGVKYIEEMEERVGLKYSDHQRERAINFYNENLV